MKCPGQDTMFWKPGDVYDARCPGCGTAVEFFKDDTARTCGNCGRRFANPGMDFGCAAYCPYAEQCLGDLPPEAIARRRDLLKERVAVELKRHLKADFKRIGRASRAVRHAEFIGGREGGNLAVVLPAACLHVLVTVPSDEGFDAVKAVLSRAGAPPELADEVTALLKRIEDAGNDASPELAVLTDAVALSRMEEALTENPSGVDDDAVPAALRTDAGRESAMKLPGKEHS